MPMKHFVGGKPPAFPGNLCKGSSNRAAVKLLQEYLSLSGYTLVLDGIFGNATAQAIYRFSFEQMSPAYRTDMLTKRIWQRLISGMTTALTKISLRNAHTFNSLLTGYAKAHLSAKAHELLKKNMGPWVRLYMEGLEGSEYPWCAGFVSFLLRQVCLTYGKNLDALGLDYTYSCDVLGAWGATNGTLVKDVTEDTKIPAGSIFLVHRTGTDYVHTGIVTFRRGDIVETIEGNTNAGGSREGTSVMRRFRSMDNLHFIVNYARNMPVRQPQRTRNLRRTV